MNAAAERGRLVRCGLVGGIAEAGNGVVMTLAARIGFGAFAAAPLAFVAVTPIACLFHARATFGAADLAGAGGLRRLTGAGLVSMAMVELLRDDVHRPTPVVAIATCAAMVPLNSLLSRLATVRRRAR